MKTILITGNTGLITGTILEQISDRFSVVLTTDDPERKEDFCRIYHTKSGAASFEQLFQTYAFAAVWHISAWADMGEGDHAIEDLGAVYELCRENHIRQLLVVSSSLLTKEQMQEEEDCLFATGNPEPHPVLIRAPGILTNGNQNTSLGRILSGVLAHDRKIWMPETEDENYEYLPMADVVLLLKRITMSAPERGVYQLSGEYTIRREQLAGVVASISKKSRLVSDGRKFSRSPGRDMGQGQLSRKYAYFAKDQKQLPFHQLYEEYRKEKGEKSGKLAAKRKWIRRHVPDVLMKILDIVVLFVLAEIISKYMSEFVYFKEIDVRLIYIFLIATCHGLKAGVVASLAECVVLYYQYQMLGVYGLQLFYNVENWIPFALCIVTGAVTGYFSDLKADERRLVDKENALLREKYLFLKDMYNVSSEVRDEYRRQILTFENSYGKIFDAVKCMNCDTITEVCAQGQKVLAGHLENPSVCIYQWVPAQGQARLLASADSSNQEDREELLPGDRKALFDALRDGRLFINNRLEPGVPMYGAVHVPRAAGHEEADYEPILILIWEAAPEQMNDYFANQFEILCGLMGNALDRAALLACVADPTEEGKTGRER